MSAVSDTTTSPAPAAERAPFSATRPDTTSTTLDGAALDWYLHDPVGLTAEQARIERDFDPRDCW